LKSKRKKKYGKEKTLKLSIEKILGLKCSYVIVIAQEMVTMSSDRRKHLKSLRKLMQMERKKIYKFGYFQFFIFLVNGTKTT
jgi:hypothetical protein